MRRIGSVWVLALCGSLAVPVMAQQTGQPAGDAEGRYSAALALAGGKKWSEAAPALEKCLADFPMHAKAATARLRLGEAYLALNKPELAGKVYDALLAAKLPPDLRADALLGAGRAKLAAGNAAAAIAPLQELFTSVERSALLGPAAATPLGDALMAEGRYKDAALVFDHFTQWPTHADAPRAAFMTAEAYRLGGDSREAVFTYGRMLDQFGDSPLVPKALLGTAEALLQLSRYEEAEAAYRRVLQAYADTPEAPRAQLGLGHAAYLRGDYGIARSAYQAASLLFAGAEIGPEAELRIADCYLAERDLAQARTRYTGLAAGANRTVAAEALYSLARLEQGEGQWGKAGDLYDQLAKMKDGGRWAQVGRIRLAQLRLAAGDMASAVSLSRETLAGKPEPDLRDEAAVVLAEALLQKGDAPSAEGELAPVLTRAKSGDVLDRAESAAARCRLERGDAAASQTRCAALLKRELAGETRADVLATLGAAQLAAKDETGGVASLRQALNGAPTAPGGRRAGKLLVSFYRKGGKETQAREIEAALNAKQSPVVLLASETMLKADAAVKAGRHAEAIGLFGQVLEGGADPERRLQARAGIIAAAAQLRRPADVTAQLAEISKEQPPVGFVARAALRAGQVLLAQGDRAGAESVLRAGRGATTEREGSAELALALARVLNGGGKRAEAEPLFREAAGSGAKAVEAEALYALAWIKQEAGGDAEAEPLFRQIAAEYPEHPLAADAHYRLGEREFAAGHFPEAVEQYRAALRGKNAAADRVSYRLGWALRQQGEHVGAAEAFARAGRSADPSLAAESRVRSAEEYLQAGKAKESLEQLEPLLEKDTLSPELRVQVRATAAQASNAVKEYARTVELTAGDAASDDWYTARLLLARAEALRKQSGAKAAAVVYSRVATRFAQHAEVAAEAGFRAGECQRQAGDETGARASWERVAQLFPDSSWAQQSRKRLDEPRKPVTTRPRK